MVLCSLCLLEETTIKLVEASKDCLGRLFLNGLLILSPSLLKDVGIISVGGGEVAHSFILVK